MLCKKLTVESSCANLMVVFVSNPNKTVPFWGHNNDGSDTPVIWDYHVFAIMKKTQPTDGAALKPSLVFDLDARTFPCPFDVYLGSTLRASVKLLPRFQRRYKVIPADEYLRLFASDRSHMKTADSGWCAPPPSWPCIVSQQGTTMNLPQFWDMEEINYGANMSEDEFIHFFS